MVIFEGTFKQLGNNFHMIWVLLLLSSSTLTGIKNKFLPASTWIFICQNLKLSFPITFLLKRKQKNKNKKQKRKEEGRERGKKHRSICYSSLFWHLHKLLQYSKDSEVIVKIQNPWARRACLWKMKRYDLLKWLFGGNRKAIWFQFKPGNQI